MLLQDHHGIWQKRDHIPVMVVDWVRYQTFTQGTGVLVLLAMYGYIVDLLFLALSPIDWN